MLKYLHFFLIFLFLIDCASTVKIPIVKSTPKGFENFIGSGRDLGLYVYKSESANLAEVSDWKKVIQGEVIESIRKKGYFNLVDMSSRENRLKEIAYSQLMGKGKDISKELSVDVLLFIEIPQSPASECRNYSNVKTRQVCNRYDANGRCLNYIEQNYTQYGKQLSYTVFVKARLVNLETGENLENTNSSPAILKTESESPNFDCPSSLEGFKMALDKATSELSNNLSPTMEDMEVPIYDDGDGISDSDIKSEVKGLLSTGNKWLSTDKPNLEQAKTQWEKALRISGGSSTSAYWNLGVYHWSKGDVRKAEENFKKAENQGGPDWLDSNKRNILSIFESEKKRIIDEEDN
ncbi:MAG: hypothetical protein H7A24_07860 [Leptospiraceae bacterium]|nr:hypothetical protein [Leptospiraceae bacterium]MCP5511780.1 hypothetical protein [Leptospiraceae bacterium]